MFVLHKLFQPSLKLRRKAGAYFIVEQLKCTFTWVGSWPLPVANALAYHTHSKIMEIKNWPHVVLAA